jgi:hypothetical protein
MVVHRSVDATPTPMLIRDLAITQAIAPAAMHQ